MQQLTLNQLIPQRQGQECSRTNSHYVVHATTGYYQRRASSRRLLQPVQTFIYGNNSKMHASRASAPSQSSGKLVYLDISSNIQQGSVILSSFKHVCVSKQQQPVEDARPRYLYKEFLQTSSHNIYTNGLRPILPGPSSLGNLGVVTNLFGWL